MGSLYGEENGPLMCFNAAKSWQLGWYDDKAVIVSPSSSSWSGRMMGISDYSNSSTQTVLLKLETGMDEDYYVNFNRKSGINRDVRESGDQVLVIMQDPELWRIRKIGEDQSWQHQHVHFSRLC